jgi:hypothetical protein
MQKSSQPENLFFLLPFFLIFIHITCFLLQFKGRKQKKMQRQCSGWTRAGKSDRVSSVDIVPTSSSEEDGFHSQGLPLPYGPQTTHPHPRAHAHAHAHAPVGSFSQESSDIFEDHGGEKLEDLSSRMSSALPSPSGVHIHPHLFTFGHTLSDDVVHDCIGMTGSIESLPPLEPGGRVPSVNPEAAAIIAGTTGRRAHAVEEEEGEGGHEKGEKKEGGKMFIECGSGSEIPPSGDRYAQMTRIAGNWLLTRKTRIRLPKHLEDFSERCHCVFKTAKSRVFSTLPDTLIKSWRLVFCLTGFSDQEDSSKCSFDSYLVHDESLTRVENGLKDAKWEYGPTGGMDSSAVMFSMQLNKISFHQAKKDAMFRIAIEIDDGALTLFSPTFKSFARKPQNRPDLDVYANGEGDVSSPSHSAHDEAKHDDERNGLARLVEDVAIQVIAMGESARRRFPQMIKERLKQ